MDLAPGKEPSDGRAGVRFATSNIPIGGQAKQCLIRLIADPRPRESDVTGARQHKECAANDGNYKERFDNGLTFNVHVKPPHS